MINEAFYSTSMTGSGFLMYEFKQLASLKLDGLSDDEIRTKVLKENLFQYNKLASLKRAFPYLLKRVNTLDSHLQQMVVSEPTHVGKVINLYATMKADQLFYEFMEEVVTDSLEKDIGILEKKDVNVFFVNKAEQSDFLKSLAESTVARLKSAYLRMLLEVGMLSDLKSRELKRLVIDEELKRYLLEIGEGQYVKAMGDEGIQ
ncbi:MAG TPA: DUF1819 family protein [Atopostipes sp.]|nr:DUF1819 family protein [Atopostipes sp.]